jgi:hypothetical protein
MIFFALSNAMKWLCMLPASRPFFHRDVFSGVDLGTRFRGLQETFDWAEMIRTDVLDSVVDAAGASRHDISQCQHYERRATITNPPTNLPSILRPHLLCSYGLSSTTMVFRLVNSRMP